MSRHTRQSLDEEGADSALRAGTGVPGGEAAPCLVRGRSGGRGSGEAVTEAEDKAAATLAFILEPRGGQGTLGRAGA